MNYRKLYKDLHIVVHALKTQSHQGERVLFTKWQHNALRRSHKWIKRHCEKHGIEIHARNTKCIRLQQDALIAWREGGYKRHMEEMLEMSCR